MPVNKKIITASELPQSRSLSLAPSPKVNLRSVVGKTRLGSFWCFSGAHGGLLGGSHTTDCTNETSDPLLSPHETAHHRYSFHPVPQTGISWNAVEIGRLVEREPAFSITLTWFSSSAHTRTQRSVWISLAYFFLSLCPLCLIFYFSSATHIHWQTKKNTIKYKLNREIMYKPTTGLEKLHYNSIQKHYIHLNTPALDVKALIHQHNVPTSSIRFIQHEQN